jgi:hypothetical protein
MQKWIIAQRGLNPVARVLLYYYSTRANGELVCFPSFSKTAQDCELTRRGVIKGTGQLCAGGQISVVSAPSERTAILTKAGAKHNSRANVYRINLTNGATDDGEHSSPSQANGAHSSPSDGEHSSPLPRNEAELLALCVPIKGEHSSPSDPPDGEHSAPSMVNTVHSGWCTQFTHDGEHSSPESRESELRESELSPRVNAQAREGAPLARSLSGAPGAPREPEAGTEPPTEPAATTGGGATDAPLAKAPAIGAGATSPTQGLRKPGAPPDPFADWLEDGAPAARALALAITRPKPLYAPPDVLKAARQRLAQRAATLADA